MMPERLKKLNRIRVKDSDLDFFKEFFREHYNGNPMPRCFEEVMIEITGGKNGSIELYVDYRESDKVQIHCYVEKMRIVIISMDESGKAAKDGKNGEYLTVTATTIDEDFYALVRGNVPKQMVEQLSMYSADIFNYMFLYYHLMKDKVIKQVEDVNLHHKGSKSNRKKAKKAKPTRRTIFIPKCISRVKADNGISTGETTETTTEKMTEEVKEQDNNTKARQPARYTKSEWQRKGCTYCTKKGTIVVRAASTCHRQKPLATEGIDYIVRPPSESK